MLKNWTRKYTIIAALAGALSLLAVHAAVARPASGRVQLDPFRIPKPVLSPVEGSEFRIPNGPIISAIRITNVTDKSFSASWLTDVAAGGEVRYGTDPASLGNTKGHDADISTSAHVHHVTIGGLTPDTTYYFDVVSDGTVGNNSGAHYQFTTPPTASVPGVDYVFGSVYQQDGTTPMQGAVAYVTLVDRDGSGSPGASATLSAVTNSEGVWFVNLASARTDDYSVFFEYTAAGGDDLHVQVQATPTGMAALVDDVGQTNDANGNPVSLPDLALSRTSDVNGDGTANVIDLMEMATRLGSQRTNSNYLPRADLDVDGDIDISDIQRGAAGWRQ